MVPGKTQQPRHGGVGSGTAQTPKETPLRKLKAKTADVETNNDFEHHQDHVVDNFEDLVGKEHDQDSASNSSGGSDLSHGSTTKKLVKIEKEIQRTDLSKRQKRLLQNRKSALKCRLKK